jgi:hypothetical protein
VRHAISAALIAAVGDRDAQIRNPMAVAILHLNATLPATLCSIKKRAV